MPLAARSWIGPGSLANPNRWSASALRPPRDIGLPGSGHPGPVISTSSGHQRRQWPPRHWCSQPGGIGYLDTGDRLSGLGMPNAAMATAASVIETARGLPKLRGIICGGLPLGIVKLTRT